MRVCTLFLAAACWLVILAITFLARGDSAMAVVCTFFLCASIAGAGITWPVDPLDVDEYMGEAE